MLLSLLGEWFSFRLLLLMLPGPPVLIFISANDVLWFEGVICCGLVTAAAAELNKISELAISEAPLCTKPSL